MRRAAVVALVVAGAAALAGCGTVPEAQAVKSWMANASYTAGYNEIRGEVTNAVAALSVATTPANALHTVCAALDLDTEAGYNALPTPDTQATHELATAYNTIGSGATTCYGAAGKPVVRQRAITDLKDGAADLYFATQRLTIARGS